MNATGTQIAIWYRRSVSTRPMVAGLKSGAQCLAENKELKKQRRDVSGRNDLEEERAAMADQIYSISLVPVTRMLPALQHV